MQTLLRVARHVVALPFLVAALPAVAAFTDNGDGTVTDTGTGLMWDKCSWGQTDTMNCTDNVPPYTWSAALAQAVTANAAHYKGHNDWRLPNKNELASLVAADLADPAIDTTAFPFTSNAGYWASTTAASEPSWAWYVAFGPGPGGVAVTNKDANGAVRLVRGGQPYDALAAGAAESIPTLSEWGLILLGGLLAAVAGLQVQRAGRKA